MSRALVIKGADFELNRVAQVNFTDVPCTAIEFTEESYNVTSMSVPTVPEFVKTPASTSDAVVLSVADTNVAKVVNGGLYAVGFGTTTVTAICGNATATATIVVSSIEVIAKRLEGVSIQDVSSWGSSNPLRYTVDALSDSYCVDKVTPLSTPDGIYNNEEIAVIKIPTGTTKIRLESNKTNWSCIVRYATTESTLHIGDVYYAKFISNVTKYVPDQSANYVNITDMPSNANAFVIDKTHSSAVEWGMKAIFTNAA